MKRVLIGGAAALAVAAAGGWGLWRWGASEIEARIDAEAARLAAEGVSATWSARRVSGFPTGYVVRLESVALRAAESGGTVETAWVEGRVGLMRAGEAVVTTASPILATGPAGPADRLTIVADGLTLTGPIEGDGPRRLDARTLTLTPEGGAASLALEGVALSAVAAGEGATVSGTIARARTMTETPAGPTTNEARDVDLTARALGLDPDGLAALIAENGAIDATIAIGASRSEAPGLRTEGGPARTRLEIGAGRLSLTAEAGPARYEIGLPGAEAQVGRIDVAGASVTASAPLLRAAAAQPFALALSVAGAAPDAAAWAALDPAATLPREPFAGRLDLAGTARLAADLTAAAESPVPPVALETLELRALEARGGGLDARASGAMALLRDGGGQGRFDVSLAGWAPLLAALVDLGLVGPEQAALFVLTAERYNAPDAPEGAFVAEVLLDGPVAFVNGAPLQ